MFDDFLYSKVLFIYKLMLIFRQKLSVIYLMSYVRQLYDHSRMFQNILLIEVKSIQIMSLKHLFVVSTKLTPEVTVIVRK